MLIPHPLGSAALARPQAPCLHVGAAQWTAPARAAAAARRAALLRVAHHVAAGDCVGLWGPVGEPWLAGLEAITWAGATALLLPPQPAAAAAAMVTMPAVAHVVCTAVPPAALAARAIGLPEAMAAPSPGLRSPALSPAPLPEPLWPAAAPFVILMTSGTTAAPRPVSLSLFQLQAAAFGSAMRLGHLPSDTWLCCLPLHHIGGLSVWLRVLWGGAAMRLLPHFDAAAVAMLLDSGAITMVSLVPTMLAAVLDVRPAQPFTAALRAILLGGAPASAALLARCTAQRLPVAPTWGMSETAAQVATAPPGAPLAVSHVGPPLALSRVLARPGDGALVVTGAQVAAPLVTGDRGAVAADGSVTVAGRRDDVIISGGENIAPEAVEARLLAHPAVAAAAVVARPHPRWGQRPVAVLVARAAASRPDAAALAHFCAATLPRFSVPDAYIWRTTLPRDGLGKLRRRALAADIMALDAAVSVDEE